MSPYLHISSQKKHVLTKTCTSMLSRCKKSPIFFLINRFNSNDVLITAFKFKCYAFHVKNDNKIRSLIDGEDAAVRQTIQVQIC